MQHLDEILNSLKETHLVRPIEMVSLNDAIGRIVAFPIHLSVPLPAFDQSIVTGFAVRVEDLTQLPISLKKIGSSYLNSAFKGEISQGETVFVESGCAMPNNANAVIEVSQTTQRDAMVTIKESVMFGHNVYYKGFDIDKGDILIEPRKIIKNRHLASMSLISSHVAVMKMPNVSVLHNADIGSSNNDSVNSCESIGYNIQRISPFMKSFIESHRSKYSGISYIHGEEFEDRLQQELCVSDVIILFDSTTLFEKYSKLLNKIKKNEYVEKSFEIGTGSFEKIIIVTIDGKLLIFLPFYSPATFVHLMVFLLPVLDFINQQDFMRERTRIAKLDRKLDYIDVKSHFITGNLYYKNGQAFVSPSSAQDAPMYSNLAKSNCIVVIDSSEEVPVGQEVEVIIFKGIS